MGQTWMLADMPYQTGRLAILTGGTSGIGFETALQLAKRGAELVLPARNMQRGIEASEKIKSVVSGARIQVQELDLGDFASVRAFANDFQQRHPSQSLNLLINNAGIMAIPRRTLNADGAELQMATNHYGHFLLTALLISSMDPLGGRVITVSSTMAKSGRLDFDNLQSELRYKPWLGAYAQSKLANLVFALELSRRLRADRSRTLSIAVHPGWAVTNLTHAAGPGLRLLTKLGRSRHQSASAGALPLLFAATSPDAVNGGYYGPDGPKEAMGNPTKLAVPEVALDEAVARRLWEQSNDITGVKFNVCNTAAVI